MKLVKSFRLNYLIIALLLLSGAVVAGLTDYITSDFDVTIFYRYSFWVNIITTNIGVLCIIIAILMIKIDEFKLNDIEYNDLNKKIVAFYLNKYQSTIFKKFCLETNTKNKIEAYKYSINKKYNKLKPTPNDLYIYHNGTEEEKLKNRYCKKVKYYETLLDPDYINNTINKRIVKYNTITDSLVFSGIPTDEKTKDYVTKHKIGKVVLDLIPKFSLSLGMTFILASITPTLKDGITAAMIYNTATKLLTMLTQIYFAINYSNKYNQEVILHDIKFRYGVITDYEMWFTCKSKSTTKEVE